MKKTILTEIIASLFILLFMYAAASKLLDYQKFRIQLGQSPLLTTFAPTIAFIIPCIEILISILLFSNKFRLAGLYISFCIMNMFSTYIYIITKFSSYIPCSCGGILSKMSWNQHLVFNIIFVFIGLAGILNYQDLNETYEYKKEIIIRT